jgi:hypothetical protein
MINGNVSSEKKDLLDRIFPLSNVTISDDTRVVYMNSLKDLVRSKDIYIYESATVEGFKDGKWEDIKEIVIEGKKVVSKRNPIKVLNFKEPADIPNLLTLVDDNDLYIAQKYGNVILFSTSLTNLPDKFIEMMFTLMGYKIISEEEYITKKLQDIVKRSLGATIEELRNKVKNEEQQLVGIIQNYKQHLDQKIQLERSMSGAEKYDTQVMDKIVEQVKKIFKCKEVESVEMKGEKLIIITKPLYMGIWNIGQYSIEYNPNNATPLIKRITSPPFKISDSVLTMQPDGRELLDTRIDHPHVRDSQPCTGNFTNMLQSFWSKDMLAGVVLAIQYIKSYSKEGGPYIDMEKWLMYLGYIDDMKLLSRSGDYIWLVDNSKVFLSGRKTTALTAKDMEGIGYSGKIERDKNKWEKAITESNYFIRNNMLPSLEYVNWIEEQKKKSE